MNSNLELKFKTFKKSKDNFEVLGKVKSDKFIEFMIQKSSQHFKVAIKHTSKNVSQSFIQFF